MKTQFGSFRKIKACGAAVAWCAVVACLLPACASRSKFQQGYERGASDTVKRQYWILQDMQKRDAKPERRLSLYRMPIAPDPDAKVKTVPYEITLPIYE